MKTIEDMLEELDVEREGLDASTSEAAYVEVLDVLSERLRRILGPRPREEQPYSGA